MPYTYLTFAQLKAQLAARLDDPSNVYYTATGTYNEIGSYLIEALRTWQAFTGYWREKGHFTLTANQVFYDLPSTLLSTDGTADILNYNVKDQDLVAMIQYHLLEPATGNSWTGSTQWTLDDLTNALQNRRNQLLVDTGLVITNSTINLGVPPPVGRVPLSDPIIDVRRVAWRAVAPSTEVIPLWPADEWAFSSFLPAWNLNANTPNSHSVIGPPPLTLQLSPIPLDAGQLELLTINAGANLDPTDGVLLGVPDNFSWAVKWGALADLLSIQGEPLDPARAAYCQKRWEDAEELIRINAVIITGAINEQLTFVQPIGDLDAFNPTWEENADFPTMIGSAGLNMICASPPPGATQPYSVSMDVVRNAPVPAVDADTIQIGREDLDAILDYAQHLASFKMGGQEFLATIPLYQRFVRQAGIYNERLRGTSMYLSAIQGQSWSETKVRPRRESDVQLTV